MDSLHGFGLPCLEWTRGNCYDLEVEIHRTQDGSKSEVVVSANVAVVVQVNGNAALLAIAQIEPTASHGGPPCVSKGPTASHGGPLLLLQVNGNAALLAIAQIEPTALPLF